MQNPLYLIITKINGRIEESNGINIWSQFQLIKAKIHERSIKNYATKSKMLSDHLLITETIKMKKNMKTKFNSVVNLPLKNI